MFVDKKYVGAKIREYRKRKNLSQLELAEIVELSDKHIGRIEAGKYSPNYINFLKILEAIELDIEELGIKTSKNNVSGSLDELLELIYSSNSKEIKMLLELIKTYKENK